MAVQLSGVQLCGQTARGHHLCHSTNPNMIYSTATSLENWTAFFIVETRENSSFSCKIQSLSSTFYQSHSFFTSVQNLNLATSGKDQSKPQESIICKASISESNLSKFTLTQNTDINSISLYFQSITQKVNHCPSNVMILPIFVEQFSYNFQKIIFIQPFILYIFTAITYHPRYN